MGHTIESMLGISMEKIREMVDVNIVVGNPITTPDGIATIIPVSKVSFGFGSGGSDIPSKKEVQTFGGAAGAGVTIKPLAFLVIKVGEVELLQLNEETNKVAKIVETVPDAVSKLLDIFKKNKKNDRNAKKE